MKIFMTNSPSLNDNGRYKVPLKIGNAGQPPSESGRYPFICPDLSEEFLGEISGKSGAIPFILKNNNSALGREEPSCSLKRSA
jgi:hypothetical protein